MKEEKTQTQKKQLISARTATKGLINGFISYGFLIGFIFLIVFLIIINTIDRFGGFDKSSIINYTLPLIASIIIFFLIRIICNLSTFDLFKKCKIEENDINRVSSKMNLFFVLFILFTLVFIVFNLNIRFTNQRSQIEQARDEYYEIYSKKFADSLVVEMLDDFSEDKFNTIIQTVILEFGLFLGTFSLITTQKQLIEKYN